MENIEVTNNSGIDPLFRYRARLFDHTWHLEVYFNVTSNR